MSAELEWLAQATKARCEDVQKAFRKIESELKRQPENIQQLVQIREYMTQVPLLVAAFRDPITEIMQTFDVFEEFHYRCALHFLLSCHVITPGQTLQRFVSAAVEHVRLAASNS